jgi:PPOX class probable F420-dependent enzyme
MDLDEAREFMRSNHRGVLAARKDGGGIHQSPILVAVDDVGRAIISSREPAFKVKYLRRNPWVQLCVFTDAFFGGWIFATGSATVVSLPEAMDPLIDYYKRFPDDNPPWDEYRERMQRQQRVLIRITLESAGPDKQG